MRPRINYYLLRIFFKLFYYVVEIPRRFDYMMFSSVFMDDIHENFISQNGFIAAFEKLW